MKNRDEINFIKEILFDYIDCETLQEKISQFIRGGKSPELWLSFFADVPPLIRCR
jgi:hypothetical protein